MQEIRSGRFSENSTEALGDENLQQALNFVKTGLVERRAVAASQLDEFEDLRDQARDIKNHVLEHLDHYLEAYEAKVKQSGGHVHWARDAEEANAIILKLCREKDAKMVTKGKSMISEEIGLNAALEKEEVEVVETDLGEYIIQLRGETPSHIIAPATHVVRDQIEESFRKTHTHLDPDRNLDEGEDLVREARKVLRDKYFQSDIGITGANFLIAETGSSIIVTNEGNGDLTQTLPKTHIVIASIEKVVPTLNDAASILRVLARSATGQDMSSYTTFSTGPRQDNDPDGPEDYHVVLLDNGRSDMLGTEYQDMLRCIRCGACMNHCPVYGAVGGHAYGWVYPGPMGSVLTPSLVGVEESGALPNASTFCGRCESVCPMRIPLPKMMRHYRKEEVDKGLDKPGTRYGLSAWTYLATHPTLYRATLSMAAKSMSMMGAKKGALSSLPLAGEGWTRHRDMPIPEGQTFQSLWKKRKKGGQ